MEVATVRKSWGTLLVSVLLLLLAGGAFAQEDAGGGFLYGDVTIVPLTGNIFRCSGNITSTTGEYYQHACFNLHLFDVNGKTVDTFMFCLDRFEGNSTRSFQIDFTNVLKNYSYKIEFLTAN
jgi:hypothetical protein